MLKSFLPSLGLLAVLISCQPKATEPSEFPRHRFADRPKMYTLFDEVKKEYLFVDRVGKLLVDGAEVTSKDDFRDGAMRLWLNEKPAIIDDAGNFLVPLGFDRLLYYQNGNFFAWKDSVWTY
ncbi:MAG: hypothetical protein AAGH79_17250 [Bacteroidota bacterium]